MPPAWRNADLHAQFGQRLGQGRLKPVKIIAQGKAMPAERHDRVDGQLPWTVNERAAAAIDPVSFDFTGAECAAGGNFPRPAATANGYYLRVLAHQGDDLPVIALGYLAAAALATPGIANRERGPAGRSPPRAIAFLRLAGRRAWAKGFCTAKIPDDCLHLSTPSTVRGW